MRAILQRVHRTLSNLSELKWGENSKVRAEFMDLCESRLEQFLLNQIFEDPEITVFLEKNPQAKLKPKGPRKREKEQE